MRVLYYGESPFHATGFAQVNKHILDGLSEVADVTLVVTSHYSDDDFSYLPYKLIGCEDTEDMRNIARIIPLVKEGAWDIFFYQGDIGANNDVLDAVIEETNKDKSKSSIFYMPVDCDVAMAQSFNHFASSTVPVVYTNHAKSVIEFYQPDLAKYISVIQLGCEPDVFYPVDKQEARNRIFGESWKDAFIAVNVNRNQGRKDLARCMGAFHLFNQKHDNAVLYMHSVQNDIGGSLPTQALLAGCNVVKSPPEIAFSNLDLTKAWSREQLNDLYNACDVLVSTSHGEGWGLATTEAMAAGTPVLVPANTANLDILGEPRYHNKGFYYDYERGWAIKTGGDIDHQVFTYQNGGSPHDIIHAESFVEGLEYIYTHKEEVAEKCKTARLWCQKNTWKHKKDAWISLVKMIEQTQQNALLGV